MENKSRFCLILPVFCLAIALGSGSSPQKEFGASNAPVLRPGGSASPSSVVADMNFGRMPLNFIPNRGQLDSRVFYYVQGRDMTIFFGPEGLTFVLMEPGSPTGPGRKMVLKLDFIGANPRLQAEALEESGAVISFFRGPKEEWKTGLPGYLKVAYREVWPGIDLIYSGHWHELKHEFVVKPGADPSLIRLGYRGAENVEINDSGELEVSSPGGGLKDAQPMAWQDINGRRREVSLAYHLEPSSPKSGARVSMAYGFRVGGYDRAHPLILDPATMIYCGYIGGSNGEYGNAIAVDSLGNAYITGETFTSDATFPETIGPGLLHSGGTDAFVAKVNAHGTGLAYCGYIGGSKDEYGTGIAVDASGNAFIVGTTYSSHTTFPVVSGPDLTYNGQADVFVAKVNSSGTGLDYCGYIGGSIDEYGQAIAVDGPGNAYVAGYASPSTLPVIVGPDLTHNGGYDAFVAKVNSSGTALDYCGFIGGSQGDFARGIAVDALGNAYITGDTFSSQTTFPVIVGPDLTHNGGYDAFVAKVNSSGTGLDYCGYLGGSGTDYSDAIAVDSSGNAYITGHTLSSQTTFPVIVGPDLTHNGGNMDAFLAKVNSLGTALDYCGYIGGSGTDYSIAIAVDVSGSAYITGNTNSVQSTFPDIIGPDLTHNGGEDIFVAKVNSLGTGLDYCGYIGGSNGDYGTAIAVDSSGNAYITGHTLSSQTTFPVIGGPDLTHNGGNDAFVAKISPRVYPPSNFQLTRLENDLIFYKEYVNRLSWTPDPLNSEVIVKYRLYRKAKDQPNSDFSLFQELDASAESYDDRGLKKDGLFTYRLTSIIAGDIESLPVEVGN